MNAIQAWNQFSSKVEAKQLSNNLSYLLLRYPVGAVPLNFLRGKTFKVEARLGLFEQFLFLVILRKSSSLQRSRS